MTRWQFVAVVFGVSAVVSVTVGKLIAWSDRTAATVKVRCPRCAGLGTVRRPGYSTPRYDRCPRCNGTGTERGTR